MEEPRRSGHVTYRSYLLRLWQTMDGDRKVWRASLEQPGTELRRGFAGLRELMAFLEQTVEESALSNDDPGSEPVLDQDRRSSAK